MRHHRRQLAPDTHTLSGAYAVDALDDVERAHFEVHLGQCPVCLREVDELQETVVNLAALAASPAQSHLRTRVLAAIRAVGPLMSRRSRHGG